MKKQAVNIHSYTREFMRGNQIPVVFGVLQILMNTAGSLMLAWLIQQAVDLMSAAGTAMTLEWLCGFALLTLLVCAAAYGCDYLSRPRFTARAMAQYKNHVFQKLTQKGMAAFSKEGSSLYISALSNDAAAIETNYLGSLFGLPGREQDEQNFLQKGGRSPQCKRKTPKNHDRDRNAFVFVRSDGAAGSVFDGCVSGGFGQRNHRRYRGGFCAAAQLYFAAHLGDPRISGRYSFLQKPDREAGTET